MRRSRAIARRVAIEFHPTAGREPPDWKGTYLSSQYARLRGRRGPAKAAVAVGHSILVIAYHIISKEEDYSDLGADYFLDRQSKETYKNRLVRQLERMGHTVTLEPAATA